MRLLTGILGTFLLIACSNQQKLLEVDETSSSLDKYRANHLRELVEYEEGPISKKDLKYITFFEEKTDLNIRARFEKNDHPEIVKMATYSGKEKDFFRYGTAFFKYDGINLTINVYRNVRLMEMDEYKDHLFLPFKDATNDLTTYGGGRYIDLSTSDVTDGFIRINFNKAYNPWCAYSDGYNCPIPPLDNHLPVAIEAGEKAYKGKKKS